MKIKQIYCKGYKRFLNADFRNVDISFNAVLALVIGSNGSGKSSLMELLGMLPPDKKDFRKGGKLQFLAVRDNVEYLIRYRIGKAVECDFIVDGVEKNNGHTAKIQLELIKEYLGYTREIHQLMTDEVTFTEMSPAKRREWFTLMSTVDMSYLISTYKEARTKARDVKGALRTVDERIAQTESKIAAHELNDGALEQISSLTEGINELLRMVDRDSPDVDTASMVVEEYQKEAETLVLKARRLERVMHKHPTHCTPSNVNDRLVTVRQLRKNLTEDIEKYNSEMYEINRLRNQIKETSETDPDTLQARVQLLNDRIKVNEARITYEHAGDHTTIHQDTKTVESTFIAYINSVPLNIRPEGSQEDWRQYRETRSMKMEALQSPTQMLTSLNETLTHIDHSPEEECPNCNHKFHKNYSKAQIAQLREDRKTVQTTVHALQDEIKELDARIAEVDEYIDYVKQFRLIRKQTFLLSPLWEAISESKCLDTTPSIAIGMFNAWANSVEGYYLKREDEIERDKILSIIQEVSALREHNDPVFMDKRCMDLDRMINEAHDKQIEYANETKELEEFITTIKQYNELIDELKRKMISIDDAKSGLLNAKINKHLNLEIVSKQGQLAVLRQNQNSYDSLIAVLSDLNDSKVELQDKDEHWKNIVTALSPEVGIIAKQIKGHIGVFIARMNAIISKVWSYDLTVIPCDIDSTGLDYKFPLLIPSKKHESKDVRFGSTGQKDIIDFAFKLVAMEYLGIQDFPLFLDELGASFDSAHQNNLMHFLNGLIATKRSDQMFIINHFTSMYGGLSNTDTLVLDKDNITVPDTYNQHVNVDGEELCSAFLKP